MPQPPNFADKENLMPDKPNRVDEFQVTGHELLAAVKDLVHQGNIRRISIRNEKGVVLLEIPLVIGLAGALLVPVWAALGAVAALVARCTLVVEREREADETGKPESSGKASKQPVTRARSKPKKES